MRPPLHFDFRALHIEKTRMKEYLSTRSSVLLHKIANGQRAMHLQPLKPKSNFRSGGMQGADWRLMKTLTSFLLKKANAKYAHI